MTQSLPPLKRRPGRPPVVNEVKVIGPHTTEEQIITQEENKDMLKRNFIVINTPQRSGVRVDLADVSEYAKAGQTENDIQIVFKNGRASTYRFGTEKDAYTFLETLDNQLLA